MITNSYDLPCLFNTKGNTYIVSLLNMLLTWILYGFFEFKKVAFCDGLYYVNLIKLMFPRMHFPI